MPNKGDTMRSSLLAKLALLGLAAVVGAQEPASKMHESHAVEDRVTAAKLLAGNDINLKYTLSLTTDSKTYRDNQADLAAHKMVLQVKAFDQLYYLGMNTVGSWALVTSDGIIQIDALDDAEEAQRIIVGGYKKLGLDPNKIKYLIITHGHGDHYGGAKYIQDTYHPKVIMGAEDWDMVEKLPAEMNGRTLPPPPTRDISASDGQRLTLGKTTLTLYITPGHTPATISMIVPVTDNGRPHRLSFLGGTSFSTNPELLAKQKTSLERFTKIGEDADVDGYISNHPFFDNTFTDGKTDKGARAMSRKPAEPNPWIVGQSTYIRYMMVNLECLEAAEARMEMR
jgi:metallo-beta-lactamase class B